MALSKTMLISAVILVLTFCNAFGQKKTQSISLVTSVELESLDGKRNDVVIFNDWQSRRIIVSHLSHSLSGYQFDDSLLIHDNFYGEVKYRLLNKKFLEIRYTGHGGSGYVIWYMVLICIDKDHLFTSLHTDAEYTWVYGEQQYLDFSKLTSDIVNYKGHITLKLKHRFWIKSKIKETKEYTVNFDAQNKVFFSKQKKIIDNYKIYYSIDDNMPYNDSMKLNVDGIVSFFGFKKPELEYVCIGDNWYAYAAYPDNPNIPRALYQRTTHCKRNGAPH